MLIGVPLKPRELALFFRLDEQNRSSLPSCPARSTDPVNVGFGIVREIIVDHMADSLDIQTSGRNIRRNDDIDPPRFELADGSLTLVLSNVAIECRSDNSTLDQMLGNNLGRVSSLDKDNHTFGLFGLQQPNQPRKFFAAAKVNACLGDRVGGCRIALDHHVRRIVEVLLRDSLNRRWQRRRERQNLTLTRNLLKDPFDIFDEAHSQHLVGFVEHK